jgi:putative effector of murein hydrolase LrgA (UPF0299 family)
MPEVELKQATPESSSTWKMTLVLGVIVAIDVALSVVLRWSHYDLPGKLMGGALLFGLLILLRSMFLRNKPGSKVKPDAALMMSLICLLLATMAFNQHIK